MKKREITMSFKDIDVAGLTAGALSKLGGWLAGLREKSMPFGPADAGLERISWDATRTLTAPGMQHVQRLQGFEALVQPEEASSIRAAMNLIKGGGAGASEGFAQLKNIGDIVKTKEYMTGMDAIIKGAWDAAKSNDSILQWINGVTQAATAVGGATAGQAAGNASPQPAPVAESLNRNQLNELFGITGNKVDASTLEKAWKKAGSPTDSDAVATILQSAGVDPAVISKAYTDMSLPAPAGAVEPSLDQPAVTSAVNTKDMLAQIIKLTPSEQQQVLAYLKK